MKDGLPGSIVYHSLQDKNGFIWFATNQGVSRYDGKTFTTFTKEDGLPDNEILKLYLDKYNNVWFISFVGIPSVYSNGSIKRFDNCKKIIAICEDWQTDSIILTTDYLNLYDSVLTFYRAPNIDGKWQFTEYSKKGKSDSVLAGTLYLKASSTEKFNFYFFIVDRKNYTFYLKDQKLDKERLIKFSNTGWPPILLRNTYSCLTTNKKGVIFCSHKSLFFADVNKIKAIASLKQLDLKFDYITDLFCDNDSILWVCTKDKGLLCIKNFLTPRYTVHRFFNNSFCTSIIKDQENGYWLTTHGDGIYFIPNLDFNTLSSRQKIISQNALCIRNLGKHQLGIGFSDGNILKIDYNTLNTKQFASWISNKNNRILDLYNFRDTNMLLATDDGLYIASDRKGKIISPLAAIKGIYVSNTNIFAACHICVQIFDRAGNLQKLLPKKRATCVTGTDSILYWGTLQGVYSYSGNKIQFLGDKYPLLTGFINHLDIAPDSSLWVSTQQGLVIMKNNSIIAIKKDQGLLSNTCKYVLFNNNIAWIATNKGISRIDYRWEQNRIMYSISNITEEDGLNSNDVNQLAIGGDYIWAATAAGICWFSKNYISRPAISPLINIDRIVAGDSILPVLDTIQINYRTGKLLIDLSGISYRSGKQIQYEYRLNGADSSWSSTANNKIEFSALPFGKFIFEARAVDRWGIKSNRPKRIIIIHNPPFWKTTWFLVGTYFILAISLGAIFYTFYRNRNRKREQEYQLKKKVHDLELMALRAQMNPHFIFNCLTSIQYHIIRADIRNANTYLHKFSTLIRQILQHSTESIISLSEEIKMLQLYLELEKLRLNDRMDYQLLVPEHLNQDDLYIPTMIVQPYIENAIKHGIAPLQHRKGILTVAIKQSDDCIEFIIEDNGPGINATLHRNTHLEPEYTSMGTGITEKRITAINEIQKNKIFCRITDKQQAGLTGTGTIVQLSFPILN